MITRSAIAILFAGALLLPTTAAASEPALENEEQQTLYALGLAMSQNLRPFGLTADEISIVQAGLADGALGNEPRADLQVFGPKIDGMLRARLAVVAERERAAGKVFLEAAAGQEGALTTESGIVIVSLEIGAGAAPAASSIVKLHYHGTLRDGSVFDSSVLAGEPVTIPLSQMPPCMNEAVRTMLVGGKRKVYCPTDLAYGDAGQPPLIPPGAVLVLELELVEIVEVPDPEEAPAAAAPVEQPEPLP